MQSENFDLLRRAYDNLVKAGEGSLQAAYAFGQVIDAMTRFYTVKELGQVIGRSPATMHTYLRLFRRYPTEHALLHMSAELGTYDISRLCGNKAAHVPSRLVWRCASCGSDDVVKTREPLPDHEEASA